MSNNSNDFDKILQNLDSKLESKREVYSGTPQGSKKNFDYDEYMKSYSEKKKREDNEIRKAAEAQQNAFRQNAIRQQEQRRMARRTDEAAGQQQQTPYKNGVYFSNQRPRTAQQTSGPIPADRSSSAGVKKNGRNKKRRKASSGGSRRMTAFKSVAPLLALVLVFTTIFSTFGILCINDVLAINRKDSPVTVTIPENATTDQIIDILDKEGLISQSEFCKVFYKLTSKLKNSKKPEYLAGPYELSADMGLEGMLNVLKGKQNNAETEKLIFPEGYSIYQIFDKLATYGVCKSDYLYTSLDISNYKYNFVPELENSRACYKLEGYLFPDTYEFYIGENPISAIKRFLSTFELKWTEGCRQKAKELGMTTNQVVILASIIQKEAANKSQMAGISSVLHNRLNDPVNYPTLDCDSTYEYVSKYLAPKIGESAAQQYMSLYNTYLCEGLPVGAICNPGMDAIEAALNPSETDYYYFQHDKNGKIYYARNSAEQDKNSFEVARANSAD